MPKLKLIYNCLGNRANTIIHDRIAELVEKRMPCICIVPEQQTVIAEAAMAERLPSHAPLCFEVTNFSRLAETVFRKHGGISYNYVSDTSRALVMWRALAELSPSLKEFSFSDPGSVSAALSAVADMRARGITSSALEAAVDSMPSSTLKNKLSDLLLIQALSVALLREHYDDSHDDLDRLAGLLNAHRTFEGYSIFIDGFVSFTAQEYGVVRALCSMCDLTVALPLPSPDCNKLQFAEARRFDAELREIAKAAGAAVSEETSSGARVPEIVKDIADGIGDSSIKVSEAPLDGLRVIRAEDPYRASEFIACDILGRIQDEGASFSDFAVIVRDAGGYTGIVDSIFARYSIPCFISDKTDLTSLEPIKLIRSAYSIVSGGWKHRDVISYLKCGLSGVSSDACDEFEDYTSKWHINGSRFTDGITWNMNPDGYTVTRTEYGNRLLARVNATRDDLVSKLKPFSEELNDATTVRDHCVALYVFLLSLDLPTALSERAEDRERRGDVSAANEYRRLWKLICDSLDTLCDVLADIDIDTESFTRLLDIVFGGASLGRIPTRYDQVMIGAADMIRVDAPKHVYILGVNRDEFPAAVSVSGLFDEADRKTLREMGLDVGEDVAFLSSRELFYFYRALLFASNGVDLIYTDFATMRTPNAPATEIDLIKKMTGDRLETVDASSLPLEFYVRAAKTAAELSADAGNEIEAAALFKASDAAGLALGTRAPLGVGELSLERETSQRIFGRSVHLTQSRISDFARCPFRHFGRYVLKLGETAPAEINYRDIGNYIHSLLEVFFRTLDAEGRHLRDIPEDELPLLADRITQKYINAICPDGRAKTARLVRLFERLSRNALVILRELREEFSTSEFDPAMFEIGLRDSDESRPAPLRVPLEGAGEATVYGTVDRIDRYKSGSDVYLRIVDYKNGTHKFHYSNIATGSDLQLIIYLMSVCSTDRAEFRRLLGCAEDGQLIPAGALCFTAGGGDEVIATPDETCGKNKKSILRSGVLLNEEGILSAMDGSMSGKFIPIKKTRDGLSATAGSLLLSLDGIRELFDTVSDVIAGVGSEIRSGKISTAEHVKQSEPRKTLAKQCASCPMKPICRKPIRE